MLNQTYSTRIDMYMVDCCSCKAVYAITNDSQEGYKRTNKSFWCPYCGRTQAYLEEHVEKKLERQLQRERQQHDQTRADRDRIERSRAAVAGALTKKKRQVERTMNGVCPCCNRHFKNLERHMKSKHSKCEA